MLSSALKQVGQRVSRLDRTLIMLVVLLTSVFPVELFPNAPPPPKGSDGQYSGRQGQVVLVKVPVAEEATEVKGSFLDRTIPFFREIRAGEPSGYLGLVGIDMQDVPGTYELAVTIKNGEQQIRRLSYHVLVAKEKFAVEHLKLPKDKVDLDDKTLARWKMEQEQVRQALSDNSALRLWHSGFIEPVSGKRTGIFGSVRIMNGQPRNPHNGEDIGAPLGTDVAATNDGVVRLTVDHVFSGKGVFVDHGLGFYSMYFHLSEILVKDGDLVKAGQILGRVGATGRATGPHLHWGVKLNGARVNPYALLDLPFKNGSGSAPLSQVPTPSPLRKRFTSSSNLSSALPFPTTTQHEFGISLGFTGPGAMLLTAVLSSEGPSWDLWQKARSTCLASWRCWACGSFTNSRSGLDGFKPSIYLIVLLCGSISTSCRMIGRLVLSASRRTDGSSCPPWWGRSGSLHLTAPAAALFHARACWSGSTADGRKPDNS